MIALADLFDRIKNLSPLARIVLFSCGGLFIIGVMIVTFTGLFWPTSPSASTRRDTTTTSAAQPSPLLFGTNLTLIDRHDQVLTSAATRDLLQRIHPESIRMPVRTDLPEAVEAQAAQIIKRLGAVPVVSLQGSLDPNVLSDDTGIITTMNKIFGISVVYYEYGNEEDLVGVPADRYTTSWNAIVPLLKVLAPQAQFVGPVTYHADPSYLKSFLQKAQPRPDEVSWHEYTCTQADPETTCLSHLADWSTHLNTARSIMTAVIGRALPIMITEWNYAPNATLTDGKSNDNGFMSTWTQKALQALIANHVFASMQYSCTNTPTALVSSTNTLTVQGAVFLAEAQRAVALTQHSNTPSLEPATAMATPTLPGSLTPIAATTPSNSATPSVPTVQPTATTALPSPSPSPTPAPTPVLPTPTPPILANAFSCASAHICFYQNEDGTGQPVSYPTRVYRGAWYSTTVGGVHAGSVFDNSGSLFWVADKQAGTEVCETPGGIHHLSHSYGYFWVEYGIGSCSSAYIPPLP